MSDPRGYQPRPYGSGYPPQQNIGPPTPGGPGWPPQQQQHQHQQQGYGPGSGPGHYPPQHHPSFQGGMPMPSLPQFNNAPSMPYPPTFNNNNSNNSGNSMTGFNSPRPGPGVGPLYGPGGSSGGGRPPFSPAQSYSPGTPPAQHGMPSPVVMHQAPQPPRHQEWPVTGRPPLTQPVYPPNNPGLGYPPTSMPLGPGPGPGPGLGQGTPSPYVPKPYTQPVQHQSNMPTYNGPIPPRPSYSPNLSSTAPSPPASAPKYPEPSTGAKPVTNTTPANPVSNPLSVPPPTAYKPKTSYQSTLTASPKKDSKKPMNVPSTSPSWQSVSSTTSTTTLSTTYVGYQSSHSQHRPSIQSADSFEVDDRPTELIPYEEESTLMPASQHLPAPSPKSNTSATLQSPPAASPSSSFTAISYLPASPSHSDVDTRQSELLMQETIKSQEPLKKIDPTPSVHPISKTPSTPLPTTGVKPSLSTFVPSTTYVPSKKETPKTTGTSHLPNNTAFDHAVKVELSDLRTSNTIGTSFSNDSSIKVALNDIPARTLAKQHSDASLDSPISLDGLLESIEAMGRPGSSFPLSSSYQNPATPQANIDIFKPLPVINEARTEQKRYSLSDGPSQSTPSQPPSINRLVPKRPSSSIISQSSGVASPLQSDTSPSSPANSINFNPSSQSSQPLSFIPPPQVPRHEEAPQISLQLSPPSTAHHPHNHNHSHIGGDAMQLFSQPGFVQNPITSIAAFTDRPVQKMPSMARRAKTLRRAAGMTGAVHQQESTQVPMLPTKVTPDDLYPYLLRLILLAQEDEAPALNSAPALPATNKDTHKDLVKAVRAKVKDILAGKDLNPAYQDEVVIKALSAMEPKQFKNSTNVEELLMGFSIEMSRIQQTKNIPTNNRNAQIAIMASLVREAIQRDPFVGHEAILQRLPDTQAKTTAARPSNSVAQAEELTKVVRELFKSQDGTRHQRMNELRRNSTRQVAIEDLKKCASNLDLDSFPYPGIADYHHKEHHEEFKNRERSALNGFIRVLSAGHPNLASVDKPKRQFHPSEFTFIPQNPKAYYHLLLEMCIDNALAARGGNDSVSNLLSASMKALLKDCGVRWRLTSSWREIIFMEVIKEKYREGKVSINFLLEFLQTKFYKDSDVNQWHISEVNMLGGVYGDLNHMIFDNINHDIKDLQSVNEAYFAPMLEVLDRVHQQEVYQRLNIDLTPFFEDIKETVLTESIRSYNAKDEEIQKEPYENETVPLTKVALFIVSEHGIIKKRFPKPLFGTVDVAAIVVENNLRNFVPLMQNMANMDAAKLPMADVFPLYKLCRELVILFETYAPSSSAHFNISTWFRPYVLKYLEILDESITEWVTAAIKQDEFEEVSVGAGHSSSASDLFAFFYEPLTWVKGLNWPDEHQRATFFSKLANVFCKAVDLYAQCMETMFNGCMPPSVSAAASAEVKTLSEQLASFTFRSESAEAKKASQFVFTPKMCVMVNNIEAVRQRLDELYRNMDVDEAAEILREYEPVVEPTPDAPRQFEIKFVCAERLLPLDSNEASDPFIVMWHEGKEVFRSKTISANINPRWNEVFEVTLTKDTTYLIRIYDADKVHKDRLCGWQYLSIDPQDYEDYMAHDIWLDLTQIGRLLLRITMKGEREDIQFFFGRTFRSLKRKEADMSAMIVDAMIPSVKACLTEKVLFNNFRSKAMFSFFGSSVSSTKVTQVSDEDCDNALGQLIDYMEASLPVLYDYLTTEGMTMVITKLWKEMLITIESLLMPPLSNTLSDRTPLTEIEMHVVFKVIEFIKLYLNGGDAGDGFPLKVLEIPKYKDLLTVRPIYDASAEELIAEYNHSLTVPGRGRLGRQQSDYDRRLAGAVKRPGADSLTPNPEAVLRILRMRHEDNVEEFLRQAIDTQSKAREARAQAKRDQMTYQRQMRGNHA